jgi:hypothetical protein
MTPLRKLTFLILIIVFLIFVAFYFKYYTFLLALLLLLILLCYKWYVIVTEEFIVYQLMNSNGKIECGKLIDQYGKKVKIALKNLKKRKIVEQDGKVVILIKEDYQFSLKQMGSKRKK